MRASRRDSGVTRYSVRMPGSVVRQTAIALSLVGLLRPARNPACGPTGCSSSFAAWLHVTEACKIADVRVPDDVAILGVDNDVLVCDLSDPPLSSIALNTEEAGYQAAKLLADLMAGEPMNGQRVLVEPTHIVERQSTNILAVEDAGVAGVTCPIGTGA